MCTDMRVRLRKKGKIMEQVAVATKAFEDTPSTVAFVKVKSDMTLSEKLEYAYRWTQKTSLTLVIEGNGDGNDDVIVMGDISDGYGLVAQVGEQFWLVLRSM